jgi:hypothetical protein
MWPGPWRGHEDIPGHPFVFAAFVDREDLAELGLLKSYPYTSISPRRTMALGTCVANLRLQVAANGLRLESRPDPIARHAGDLLFHDAFYPVDTGPLAVPVGWHGTLTEGSHIALPNDPERLATLEARLVLRDVD